MENKPIYKCDPNKNKDCNKKSCYINGFDCSSTEYKQYAKENDINNSSKSKRLKIIIYYNIGSKPHEKLCTSYDELGRWIWENFEDIRMVNIKVIEG